MRLNRLLTSTGAALLLASGLATQANAGAINMDFLLDASTVITGSTSTDATNGATSDDQTTVAAPGLSAGFAVSLAPFGAIKYAGKSLNITGTRDVVPTFDNSSGSGPSGDQPASLRLTRHQGAGLAVCSRYDDNGSSTGCREGDHEVDGGDDSSDGVNDVNESIKFDITGGYVFAVRQVTFKFTEDDDDVRMRFSTGLGTFIDFDLANSADTDWRNCDSSADTCVVDIYKLVAELDGVGGLVFNPLTDYTLGQDAIFDYLASGAGFEFAALGDDDEWKIAGAVWVDEDPITNGVPEPASMTLLGAGIMGLGYFGKRRKAA